MTKIVRMAFFFLMGVASETLFIYDMVIPKVEGLTVTFYIQEVVLFVWFLYAAAAFTNVLQNRDFI